MPSLVAYRDGFTDSMTLQPIPWKTAPNSMSVDLKIQGAYSVAVVCTLDNGTILTWQAFHTVGDDTTMTVKEPTLQTGCQHDPVRHAVTGTLTHAGFAHLGDADTPKLDANGAINLPVPDGTYDLIATQTDAASPAMNKTLITRNVAATGQNLGNIDATTGTALLAITPELDNGPPPPDPDDPTANTETVTATVSVQTKNNTTPAVVSTGDFDLDRKVNKNKTVTVYALPDAALAAGDSQTVTYTGSNDIDKTKIHTTRLMTKPIKMGDDNSAGKSGFALPALLATADVSPGWDFDKNRLGVALPALPALDVLTITTSGQAMGGAANVRYEINITQKYFGATALARPVFDTDIPNFMTGWMIDFKKPYTRQIKSQRDVFNKGVFVDHEESVFFETVAP